MTCPSSEMLVAAADRDAPRDVRETVADHLVTCPRCAEEFRVLTELGPWAADHVHLLGESARTATTPPRSTKFQTLPGRLGSPWAYATAAVLVLAVAALELQVRQLQRDNRTLAARADAAAAALSTAATPATSSPGPSPSASFEARIAEQQRTIQDLERRLQTTDVPELNAPIIDLEPAGAQRSATPSTPVIPPGAGSVVFILNTTHAEPGASYDVDLVGADNRVRWTGSGLKQSADRTLTLVVPRTLVRDATSVRLYARAGSRRTLVEQFTIPAMRQ
jgi:hypothetical protein